MLSDVESLLTYGESKWWADDGGGGITRWRRDHDGRGSWRSCNRCRQWLLAREIKRTKSRMTGSPNSAELPDHRIRATLDGASAAWDEKRLLARDGASAF